MDMEYKGYLLQIDEEDKPILERHSWKVVDTKRGKKYLMRSSRKGTIYFHRIITQCPKGMEVDHKDGNGLNNQKSNLKVCSHIENNRNMKTSNRSISGYKGVSWSTKNKKWRADISVNNKSIYLGLFDKPEDAYTAYCEASKQYHGEFGNIGG